MSSIIKYLRTLPYLLVIFLGVMWYNTNNNASYEKSQREFWTAQYEQSRKNLQSLKTKYDRDIKELREKDVTIVEVITKPDGTIIKREERTEERTETRDTQREESSEDSSSEELVRKEERRESETAEKRKSKSAYSITVAHPVASAFSYRRARFDVGARIGQLPLSAVVGSDGKFSNIYLGLRIEF